MRNSENPGTFQNPYRYVMAVLILVVPFCSMVPYVAPAVFMGDIMATFQVDMGLAGLAMTIQLGATGVCMFIGSFIQDRIGIRKSIIASIWAMAIGNGIAFLAPNMYIFLFARFISGFGQGLYTVSMTPCISTWFGGKERSYVLMLNSASNSIFLAISYSIGRPLSGIAGSWQRVIGIYTVVIIAVALIWTFFSRDNLNEKSMPNTQAAVKKAGSLLRAVKEPEYWKLMVYASFFTIANTSIASFLPTYLTVERGLNETVATSISSLNSLLGIAGSLVGGFLAAQIWRRKPILIGSVGLYILTCFGLTIFSSPAIIIVLALAAGFLFFAPITAQSNAMIEAKKPFDPTILAGAACIVSGIGQLLCVVVPFIFNAISSAFSMTVAYRTFFALCLVGMVSVSLMKEPGTDPGQKAKK